MNFNNKKFFALHGRNVDFEVAGVSQSSDLKPRTIAFALRIDSSLVNRLSEIDSVILFVPQGTSLPDACGRGNVIISVMNPRFSYIKTTRAVFDVNEFAPPSCRELCYVHPSAVVSISAELAPFSYVGPDCVVDDACVLGPGARLIRGVSLGKNTKVGANTVVGGWGFGIERDNGKEREVISFGGDPLKMPHYGGVVIGENCEIGSLTTICGGAILPTTLGSSVMIDDHVHIAHNCKIGRGAAITACAEVSGSVIVGDEAWIGPNACVMQKISIGARSIIGIGAVVTKSVADDSICAGNPARPLKK